MRLESLDFSLFISLLRLVAEGHPGAPLKRIKLLLCSPLRRAGILSSQGNSVRLEVLAASLKGEHAGKSSLAVLNFLENCMLRFSQKSLKYYEETRALSAAASTPADQTDSAGPANPLLATLVEQWPFVVKAANTDEQLQVARWLARFLSYSRQSGEDEILISTVRERLMDATDTPDCRAALMETFESTQLADFLSDAQAVDDVPPLDSEKKAPQNPGRDLASEFKLHGQPPKENEDHPGLNRWRRKDVQAAIEDGDISELVICSCSRHEEIRKQADISIKQFMSKLKVFPSLRF